eukprot:7102925-Pyramimonas_sp.AAC.1
MSTIQPTNIRHATYVGVGSADTAHRSVCLPALTFSTSLFGTAKTDVPTAHEFAAVVMWRWKSSP